MFDFQRVSMLKAMLRMFGKSDRGTAGCHPSMASNAPGSRGQLMACCVRAAGLAYGNPGQKPSKTKLQLKMCVFYGILTWYYDG